MQIIFDKLGMEEYRVRLTERPRLNEVRGRPETLGQGRRRLPCGRRVSGVPWSEEEGEVRLLAKTDFVVDVIGRGGSSVPSRWTTICPNVLT